MSEPVTIWNRNPTGTAYLHPDGYGTGRVLGTPVVDRRCRAKHLTDAECAAIMWQSHFHYMATDPGPERAEEARCGWVAERFATHDQAV